MPKYTVKELVLATTLIAIGLAFNTAFIPPKRKGTDHQPVLPMVVYIGAFAAMGAIIGARVAPSGKRLIGAGIGAGIVLAPSALIAAFVY